MSEMTREHLGARKYVSELREIAGMVAQTPDGPLRWKQYRLTAIADYFTALIEAKLEEKP